VPAALGLLAALALVPAAGVRTAAGQAPPEEPPPSRLERVIHGFGYRPVPAAAAMPPLRYLEVDELGPYWLTESAWRDARASVAALPPGEEDAPGVLEVSPHDPDVVYHAGRGIHRTGDDGAGWTRLADPPAPDDPSVRYTVLEESPLEPGVLWAGTSDGRVRSSRDGGRTWADASPGPGSVRSIEPSAHDGARAYLALDGVESEAPRLYRTDDQGVSWTALVGPVPGEVPTIRGGAHAVREDPELEGLVFAGTEEGLFVSFDEGESWDGLQLDLPPGPVRDLRILGRDLLVDGGDRGVWVLRDLSPLRQVLRGLAAGEPYLFEPAPAYRLDPDAPGGLLNGADNPMLGAVFDYLLPSIVGRVRIEVVDADGRVVMAFGSDRLPAPVEGPAAGERAARPGSGGRPEGTRSGVHRIAWDLRPAGPDGAAAPPLEVGGYRLRMTVDGMERERAFEVLPDPRRPGDG